MPIQRVIPAKNASYEPAADDSDRKSPASGTAVMVIVIIVALLAMAGCVWLYLKYSNVKKQMNVLASPQGQQEIAKQEAKVLLEKVGKLIVLPIGEEPTIATITDADSLKKEQEFYKDALNGDKVIIYMQTKKAIIYNEAKNILINVGPIFVNDGATTTPSPTPTPSQTE